MRDPTIIYNSASNKYFVFSTGDHIPILTSTSLLGPWTKVGAVLPSCTIITDVTPPGDCSLWAPDVHFVNGEYVLYYAVSTGGSQNSAIGVATSPTMEPGTWTDYGEVMRSHDGDAFNSSTSLLYALPPHGCLAHTVLPSRRRLTCLTLVQLTRTSSSTLTACSSSVSARIGAASTRSSSAALPPRWKAPLVII